jgi:NifU-like protein involved in Fe-S cluster formation
MKREAELMFDEFHRMVKDDLNAETEQNHLGRLNIFARVREFPARPKCASLSWRHAARGDGRLLRIRRHRRRAQTGFSNRGAYGF